MRALQATLLRTDLSSIAYPATTYVAYFSNSSNRAVPYSTTETVLQILKDDVEMWMIDLTRAGFVEGRLPQKKQKLPRPACTCPILGAKDWAEIEG